MASVTITTLDDFKRLRESLECRWTELEAVPKVFRYKLNVAKQKRLSGRFNFFVQLNMERTTLRRPPEPITSLKPPFDETRFNFNKINANEILLECMSYLNGDQSITFVINSSPLTKYHSLICPNLKANQSQILTKETIACAIDIMSGLHDRNYRLGYNSAGAFASVNHLHLHLLYLEQELAVDNAPIEQLAGPFYRLDRNYPATGFCFPLLSYDEKDVIVNAVMQMIEYFYDALIPHNVFWTFGSLANKEVLKIFIFPRKQLSTKLNSAFNVAFCELSGYIVVGDEDLFESITEEFISEKISAEVGVLPDLEQDLIKLYTACN